MTPGWLCVMWWSVSQRTDRLDQCWSSCLCPGATSASVPVSVISSTTMETILTAQTSYCAHSPPLTFHLGFLIDIWASGHQDTARRLKINIVVRKSAAGWDVR